MFKEERTEAAFEWSMLGDVPLGRPNLGRTADVAVYRLMQFTLRDVLIKELGVRAADRIFYDAGFNAGRQFARNVIGKKGSFNAFLVELQEKLNSLGIGILKVEKADMNELEFTLTVAEDLDCSGLPVCAETVCTYDEGFIGGLLSEQTGRKIMAKEVDCWCTGDRVCRFDVKPA